MIRIINIKAGGFKRKKKQKRKRVEIWKTLKGVSHIPTRQATTINCIIIFELRESTVRLNQHTSRKSKNGDERISPLSETLVIVLKQYLLYRDRMPLPRIMDEKNYFFVSPIGTRCSQGVVYDWFRKALAASGIPHQGDHKGPRLHDLRHTFAVHSLIKMSKSGLDLYYSLPLLSTCLGHRSLKSTDQYVRLTAEIYQDLLEDGNEISANIFPKTKTNIGNGNN